MIVHVHKNKDTVIIQKQDWDDILLHNQDIEEVDLDFTEVMFSAIELKTKEFRFDRSEANER